MSKRGSTVPSIKTVPESISEDSTESYNPFEHRNVQRPTSDFGALAHMLKASLGSGILAMPMAFKNSGLVFGSIGSVVIGIICTHCIYLLVYSSQCLCKRHRVPTLTYAQTAEKAFESGPEKFRKLAKTMGVIITVQLLGSFILGNSVYVVFMSESINQLVVFFTQRHYDVRYYVLMLWLPLILMCLLPNLKALVPFSILANIFVTFSFGIILYYIFRNMNQTESVYLVAPFERIPLFLSTVIFAIEGIGTVLTLENEMEHPEHFVGGRFPIAYGAMAIVVTIYSIVGFFGYLEYGEATKGSVTLNLPIKDILAQTVKILVAAAIFFTYALQFYVPIQLIYDMVKNMVPPKFLLLCSFAIRAGLVTLTIIIATTIPYLEAIIGLVGAICFATLGLLMPAIIDTMTRYPLLGPFKWHLIKNIIISIISIVTLISGTYATALTIHSAYMKK